MTALAPGVAFLRARLRKQLEMKLAERGVAWFIMSRFAHVAELADALL